MSVAPPLSKPPVDKNPLLGGGVFGAGGVGGRGGGLSGKAAAFVKLMSNDDASVEVHTQKCTDPDISAGTRALTLIRKRSHLMKHVL